MSTIAKRLELLERLIGREPECSVCRDRPATVVVYDPIEPDGPVEISDTRCSACRSPHSTTRFRVIYDDEGSPPYARQDEKQQEVH